MRGIEITGLKALLYDQLLAVGTAGLYDLLIRRVVRSMGIDRDDRILDMGAGTGKNARLMARYLHRGEITGIDISPAMVRRYSRMHRKDPRVEVLKARIEDPLPYRGRFDKVLLSFVLHGFEQENRISILRNAGRALKPGGKLFLFDWNGMDIDTMGPLLKIFFHRIECPPAVDFIGRDIEGLIEESGFHSLDKSLFWKRRIRLLTAVKDL
jgi:ubiquinone/menaquinone biosynthesis C-methylase UbiE